MNLNALEQKLKEINDIKSIAEELENEFDVDVQIRNATEIDRAEFEMTFGKLMLVYSLKSNTVGLHCRDYNGNANKIEHEDVQSVNEATSKGHSMLNDFCQNVLDKLGG